MRNTGRLALFTFTLLALLGCGQKGALYLPQNTPQSPAESDQQQARLGSELDGSKLDGSELDDTELDSAESDDDGDNNKPK